MSNPSVTDGHTPTRTAAAGPGAIVLECSGAPEGALNVVRSLGPARVHSTVIVEDARSPATASRYCHRTVTAPNFTVHSQTLLTLISEVARTDGGRPVVFPTADPDLLALAHLGDRVRAISHVVSPCPDLTLQLSDKRRFAELTQRLRIVAPATVVPTSLADVAAASRSLRFPVILKPSHPQAWHPPALKAIVGSGAKAVRADSPESLNRLTEDLAEHGFDFLIQELIPGDDHEHVDFHAYSDASGEPRAWFTGRKLRITPPHAGSGCYVVSETVQPVVEICLAALRAMEFVGIANMNLKRDTRTGQYVVLEVNPRVSQWNILAARAGVNLPLLAWRDAQGLPLPDPPRQRDGIAYLSFCRDRHAFPQYRRERQWSLANYVRSLLRRPMVYQYFDLADWGPFLRALADGFGARVAGLRRWIGLISAPPRDR